MTRTTNRFNFLAWLAAAPLLLAAAAAQAQSASGTSQPVTWNCTGTPCPWGSSDNGNAIVWPASAGATSTRHGYTTTKAVYLPQSLANGTVVQITAGTASLFAGTPAAASHRFLTSVAAGGTFTVSGLATGEVLSVQNDGASFSYSVTIPAPPAPPPPTGTPSELITWTCTGTPCPWGSPLTGHAFVWPATASPTSTRFGYTTSKAVYLPKSLSNGAVIQINDGWADVYAGLPGASSHRLLASVAQGSSYTVAGVTTGEVISVQSDFSFRASVTLPTTPVPDPPPPPPPSGTDSQLVTWNCTGAPCPWGSSDTGQALVWPAAAQAHTTRLGYTTSKGIYLPAEQANGATISITSGTAGAYAGRPGAESHRLLTSISPGGTYQVTGLVSGEVLSIQGGSTFKYSITLPDVPPGTGTGGSVIASKAARWRCNTPGCSSPDWVSHVIDWPSNTAYSTNARSGDQSRTVYTPGGQLMHPYMGTWANGCKVTVEDGTVIIIEWQRGTDQWRETWLFPGESYTINLVAPENGAMIESYDNSPGFEVKLSNCNAQPLP